MTKTELYIPLPLLGVASGPNKCAFDWAYEKVAVLANGIEVFIVDTETLDVVQVLSGHKATVTHVLWLPSGRQFVSAESKLSNRDIVSVDSSNQVLVWDAQNAQPVYSFAHPDPNRQILDVQIPSGADLWVRTKVYILYSGNVLVIFDHAHCTFQNVAITEPSGDFNGQDNFIRLSTDPHYANQATNCIALLSWDYSSNSIASVAISNSWDYLKDVKIVIHNRISLDSKGLPAANSNNASTMSRSTSIGSLSPSMQGVTDPIKKQPTSSTSIRKLVSDIIVGPDYNSSPSHVPVKCNCSILFHPGMKDSLIVSNDLNIYLINVQFMMVLHTFNLEKLASPIVHVIATKQRPCLVSLHENGTATLRKYTISGDHHITVQLEGICSNENPRFSGKKTEVFGCTIHPVDENALIIYLNDGRLLKYEIVGTGKQQCAVEFKKHLTTPSTPQIRNLGFEEPFLISSKDQQLVEKSSPVQSFPLQRLVKSVLETDLNVVKMKLKRVTNTYGQFTCLNSRGDLLIAGTSMGYIIVLNIVNSRLKALKKFCIHSNSPVHGIEFVSEKEILTYSNISFSANPKCELFITELWTGASKSLKLDDNFHIQAIRVSPIAQYFVIVYKNASSPCELWDLPRRQLIKTLPAKLPPVTCIHWKEPSDNIKEEVFYMTDLGNFLFTLRVEGNRFLNATCVKLENTNHVSGIPVALFSRGLYVYRADTNGVMVMYNTNKKTASPSTGIGRGPLLGILRIPGPEDNYVLQFADNLVIWEAVGMKKIKHLHPGKLKTVSVTVMYDWVAYIPKATNGIRILPLDMDSQISVKFITISNHSLYPYFMDSISKAKRILSVCSENNSTTVELLQLARDFGSVEEFKFWTIVSSKWSEVSQTNNVDVFSDSQVYKDILVKTAQCVWATDYKKREEVGKVLLWSGEAERAAEIFLDTEPSDSTLYVLNGLKASISVGSNTLPEQTKAVLKIVATNLIACGDTDGGLELLCLLQKHQEACKYVESTNEWRKAILLSKTALSEKHSQESLCKYAQFMNGKKCAFRAASVYAFVGNFDRAIEVLFGARLRHLSYILLHFCERQNVSLGVSAHIRLAIRLDFARFLFDCGLQKESIQFCDELGQDGQDLKQELEILSS